MTAAWCVTPRSRSPPSLAHNIMKSDSSQDSSHLSIDDGFATNLVLYNYCCSEMVKAHVVFAQNIHPLDPVLDFMIEVTYLRCPSIDVNSEYSPS
jgi:hypothetical protein